MQTAKRPRSRPAPRLAGTGHPHLAPPGWEIGRPLADMVQVEPLTTAEATAATLAVISALGELHRGGKAHGNVGLTAVGIGADGWIRLAADGARAGGSAGGDLAAAGRLLCDLLGVGPEPSGGRTPAAERAAPALVAVGRRLASGHSGWSAEDAWAAVHDAAGTCGTEPQLVKALGDLGARAAGETEVERAVARVFLGPPLAAEFAAAPPGRAPRLPHLPRTPFRREARPAIAARPLRRARGLTARTWVALVLALVLAGALLGGIAGVLSSRPAAAHAAAPARPAVKPKAAAGPRPQTPADAVSTFFQLVQQQKLDQAALLWTPQMSSAVDLQSRFGGVQSVSLTRDTLVARDTGQGTATVAVDWTETRADGSTHEFAGLVFAVTGPDLWRWAGWQVQEVTAPAPPPQPGGGGDGDGG